MPEQLKTGDLPFSYEFGIATLYFRPSTSTGGPYSLTGTIGQTDTGVSNGGVYANSAGFWPGSFGCVVNLTDLKLLAEAWMNLGTHPADLDASGKVDLADFAVLSAWWMIHCPAKWPLK